MSSHSNVHVSNAYVYAPILIYKYQKLTTLKCSHLYSHLYIHIYIETKNSCFIHAYVPVNTDAHIYA